MSDKLIKNGRIVTDEHRLVVLAEGEAAADIAVPAGPVLVPLAVWQARRDALLARAQGGELGVWLAAGEDVAALADDLDTLTVIALQFPKFTDGRSYSAATALRTRYGYRGELRAIGEVLRDQFNYLTRCGFDALQPRPGRYTDEQLAAALASIGDFSQPYQRSVQDPLPLFRRVERSTPPQVQR
ncbi:DUF934 domain-containing protein [Thauera chlorobenzoica]|uniref:Oxidoreductase n=1 Tax=Thauera chlorobenzoica TaxID=96773 RepID=A0A1H5ULD5_9RHOO|nr:DUF934 domain-containing protein [Thauera chlorobenzoica]APR03564.1 oxidoreductase [Thauera chlorobenzoica]SEF75845.1 Uncharacterized conserved protein, DUF934 family [Thauera chlorobenzoica]